MSAREETQAVDGQQVGRRVLKYPLQLIGGLQTFDMPKESRVLHVEVQNIAGRPCPCLWVLVSDDDKYGMRSFGVFATGEDLLPQATDYLGTVHIDWTVWHIFEAKHNARGAGQ